MMVRSACAKPEQKEKSKGNDKNASGAKEYCLTVEQELQQICGEVLKLLDEKLISTADTGESKVFYQKMKADYCRFFAEFRIGDARCYSGALP